MTRALQMLRLQVAVVVLLLSACSSAQLYRTGQQWQRSQCQKIDDRAERQRCEQSAATSYEDYLAQTKRPAKP